MTDKTKSLASLQKNSNFRYSQSSSNSTENSEFDYNLYCFSQGYLNHEKGYWRGVLRNKNIDFDLRLNKDWTRRIELEGDSLEKLDTQSQFLQKFDNEYIAFINNNEIGWDPERFQNFKKKQMQEGGKKQKNKEWLLSNGVKRAPAALELRTQNFKQFEENEKNKESKRSSLSDISKQIEEKYGVPAKKPVDYYDKNRTAEKLKKTSKTDADTYKDYNNAYNAISSSANINEQKRGFGPGGINKRIDSSFTGEKPYNQYDNRNLVKDFNYGQYPDQKYGQNIRGSGKGQPQTNINLDKYNKGYGDQKYQTDYSRSKLQQTPKKSGQMPYMQTIPQVQSHPGYKSTQYAQAIRDQKTPSRKPIETGYSHPGQKYSSATSKIQKGISSTYEKNKPYGTGQDYQQYTYDSRGQKQPGYNQGTNVSYGISPSQLNTASTNKYGKPGRMKSVDGSDNFLFKDKRPYDQANTVAYDQKNDLTSGQPGQKSYSLPKKPVSDKRGQKHGKKTTDDAKFKYLPNQTPTKAGKDGPEIYEYYPLTDQKGKGSQFTMGKTPGFGPGSKYETRSSKKESTSPRVSDYDVYEYNPKTQGNLYDNNRPGYGQKGDRGKQGQYLNNRYQIHSPSSDESKKGQRSKSIQNVFAPNSGGYKGTMAYFKLKFLTTKEVCEKFWKSIDNGELSASMFDSVRTSANASRLSNYLSPSKNSFSNENTDYSGKLSKNVGLTNKLGMKASVGSSSQNYLRNYKPAYKAGNY